MKSITMQRRIAVALLLALTAGGILILIDGHNPVDAYKVLFFESFLNYWGFANTLVKASPMSLAGLAVIIPMRAGVFNIGGEGQLYIGGLFGAVFALMVPNLPGALGVPLIFVAAAIGGALWAAIPAYLKAYRGTNEVIVTLLMNFVAIHIVSYAVAGPLLADGAPYPYSDEVAEAYRLPILIPRSDAHAGFVFGVGLAVILYFWLRFTPSGFQLDLVGRNARAAAYAGVDQKKTIIRAMLIGGGLAGMAGAIEVVGLKYRLFHLFSDGYGYDGIVVAFLAALNPIIAPLTALFLAGLSAGSGTMQRAVGVDSSVIDVVEGLVVVFVAAALVAPRNSSESILKTLFNSTLSRRQKHHEKSEV